MKSKITMLLEILEKIENKRVLVVGDVILDEYVYGQVNKVSTGIKIPIIEKNSQIYRLGGAGNVAANVAGLTSNVYMIGKCGLDDAGNIVQDLFDKQGIDFYNLKAEKTIVKQRIYVDNQQIARIDENYRCKTSKDMFTEFISNLCPDVVILADYQYGVISQAIIDETIVFAKEKSIPVLFTSRNIAEFDIFELPIVVINKSEMDSFLANTINGSDGGKLNDNKEFFITLGGEGIQYQYFETHIHQKTEEKYPINVSGAGDTVMAVIALLYGETIDMVELLNIANIAGGLAVSNELTYTIEQQELIDELYKQQIHLECLNKIVDVDLARDIVQSWKKEGNTVVFTNGCYDILHLGHIQSFQYAKKYGQKLIVAVNSDASIRRLKGRNRPINSLQERITTLSYLEMIDMVVSFDEDTAVNVINVIKPDVYVKGEEYKNKELLEAEFVERVEYVPMIDGISTTQIIQKITNSQK